MNRRAVLEGLVTATLIPYWARGQTPDPLNPSFLKLAAEYSAQHQGISLLVLINGKVVLEDYPNGGSPTRAHELASGTKSFSGVMAAAAQQDGLLRLEEAVANTLTEWRSDPRRSRITISQLLHLTSGIVGGSVGRTPSYADAIQIQATAEAGSRFAYGPVPFQVFGEVMRRKLGGNPLDYLKRRIFDPIGLEYTFWRRDAAGNPHLPSGAFLTARNWAKFGELVRLGGVWQGKQVVDAALLDKCFEGSPLNPRYGLTWWLNRPMTAEQLRTIGRVAQAAEFNPSLAPDMVMAAGAGDQRLYIIRSLDLVVVRQAQGIVDALMGRGSRYSDTDFIGLLLTGKTN